MKSSEEFTNFIDAWETSELQISDKVKYSTRDVIDKNDELFHGKFQKPTDGSFNKIFYNIGFVLFRSIFQVVVKTIGLKDIQMRSLNGKGIETIALFRLAIQSYLKRIKFGAFLNDLCYFLKDGTTVVKIVDGKPVICNNHNIILPPYGGTIQETGIGEKCFYSWEDMKSYKSEWEDSWSEIERIKLLMDKNKVKDFIVYEYWNEHPFVKDGKGYRTPTDKELKDGDYKTHKGCIRYLEMQATEPGSRTRNTRPTEWEPYMELDRFITPYTKKRTSKRERNKLGDKEELYPYKELHFIKVPGRTLGFSVFELIAGIQEAYNRKMNLHDKKDILDLMGVYKHKKSNSSPSIAQQLLDNIQSGKVVEMELGEDLERLIIDTKAGELIASIDKLFELARQIVGVTESGTGIDMPATATATVGVLNKQTQQTTYDYAVEQISLFLTDMFNDFYLETILNEIDAEDMNLIVGDPEELKELDKFYIEMTVAKRNEQRFNEIVKSREDEDMDGNKIEGDISWEEAQALDELAEAETEQFQEELKKLGDSRFVNIKKEFLNGLDYVFEFYVNNEAFDKNVKIQNLLAMRGNTNLSVKKIDSTLLDLMGENPKAYEKTEKEKQEEIQMMQTQATIENSTMPNQMGSEFINANPITTP